MTVIETLGRLLDPVIVVRHTDRCWTPNGNHRLQAMRRLGAKATSRCWPEEVTRAAGPPVEEDE